MINGKERRVLQLALASRILVLGFMILSDIAFTDLSTSAHLQNFPCDSDVKSQCQPEDTQCLIDEKPKLTKTTILDELAPWDTVYLIRIATCGYEFDQINAFFPLLPLIMHYTVALTPLRYLHPWLLPVESLYALVGITVNVLAFGVAAVALHRLTMHTIQSATLADTAVVLFCFNPASVFYSAVYTETLFALCTWVGMYLLQQLYFWPAVVVFMLAGGARSNGILACWFLIHKLGVESIRGRGVSIGGVVRTVVGCGCVVTPYLAMQVHGYYTYCKQPNVITLPPSWCSQTIPSLYGYVQDAYWDVGFLRFYSKLVRWPRILQSTPVAFLSISACWLYFSTNWYRAFTLGLLPDSYYSSSSTTTTAKNNNSTNKQHTASTSSSSSTTSRKTLSSTTTAVAPPQQQTYNNKASSTVLPESRCRRSESPFSTLESSFLKTEAAPYMYHMALMTAVNIFAMHVNVMTRFLSSCPPLYWYTALYLQSSGEQRWKRVWLWGWALVYIVLGCLMFPNFMPWT